MVFRSEVIQCTASVRIKLSSGHKHKLHGIGTNTWQTWPWWCTCKCLVYFWGWRAIEARPTLGKGSALITFTTHTLFGTRLDQAWLEQFSYATKNLYLTHQKSGQWRPCSKLCDWPTLWLSVKGNFLHTNYEQDMNLIFMFKIPVNCGKRAC